MTASSDWRYEYRITAAAIAIAVLGSLPQFLFGALAPLLVTEARTSLTDIAASLLVLNGVAIGVSPSVGRLVDKLGPQRSSVTSLVLSAIGLGLLATTPYVLPEIWMSAAILGLPASMAQPVTNGLLINGLRPGRRGLAFGFKQAATPLAGMLAGLSLPVALFFAGWRGCVAVLAVGSLMLGPLVYAALGPVQSTMDLTSRDGSARRSRLDSRLVLFALAAGLASAAYIASYTYLILMSGRAGYSLKLGGTVIAFASCMAVIGRVGFGWISDRQGADTLRLAGWAMGIGSLAMAAASLRPGVAFVMFVGLMGCTAWAWNGMLHHSVSTRYAPHSASATGVVQVGVLAGAGLGPVVFAASQRVAALEVVWTGCAVVMLLASCVAALARRMPEVHRPAQVT